MASEQMFRGGVYHETETFLEVREVHIQKHGKNLDKNFAAAVNDIKESNKDKGGGDTDNKKQHIGEPHSGRYNESEEAKGVGGYLNKFEIKGVVEAAAKGLRDREEKETTMDHNRCQKAMDDTNANAQERVKQEARNNEEESEAKRVSQNKEYKEGPSEKTATKSFEETQGQDHEGIEKSSVVRPLPQMANESNTVESFQGVQERDKAKKQGVIGETKIQHAEKMNKTDESLQSQEGGKRNKVYATYADAVKANDSTKSIQEQELNENIAEKSFEGNNEQPQDGVVKMEKVTDGGSTVLGAVGETVAEIGENMIQPAKKVMEKSEEGKEGGVLGAIGETVAEIAQTTKVLALGEGETESKQSIESNAK
ncbi:hypothetical protein MtrunA17_Chr4g0041001 [Medicago truncatula]|uniref:Seed biotin-containing protein SBP65 n=1 Tax=Medicago truncatula TaxID=3880 RepID=G7JV21_MEDTR|nr:seed biotin-containing protein SBP65 [Medicago truncatula]AES89761.1 hypothetical protein MTR_4g079690 [Medicago truncatula]RHN61842.1 hypothetical protein MtrunA17_Chr4g0041001 [Medicago truncatula]